jgi:CRISPR type IV-associated protein Csf1
MKKTKPILTERPKPEITTNPTQYPTELFYRAYGHKFQVTREPIENKGGYPCAVCGRPGIEFEVGYRKVGDADKGVFSHSFGEFFHLKTPTSGVVCPYCETAIRTPYLSWAFGVVFSENMCSPIVGEDRSKTIPGSLSWSSLSGVLLNPPEPPFVIALNEGGGNGSHIIHMGTVNYGRDKYFVNFGADITLVDRLLLSRVNNIVKEEFAGKPPGSQLLAIAADMKSGWNTENKYYEKNAAKIKPFDDAGLMEYFTNTDNVNAVGWLFRSINTRTKIKKGEVVG